MSEDIHMQDSIVSQATVLMLAEDDSVLNLPSGTLVVPGEDQVKKSEKKCVRVCDKWGKRCNINPRTGQKKCMRMCEKFGEDCF